MSETTGGKTGPLSLAGVHLLRDIPAADRKHLENRCAYRRFAPGEVVVARFSAGNAVYFILAGTGRVNDTPARVIQALLLLGSILFPGTLYILALGGPRSLGVVVLAGGIAFIVG